MDQLVVDLGARGVDPGETVTVFGPGTAGEPTVADWATWADTIEHEIVCGIGARVERRTLGVPHLRSLS
jgi:alanine racemase